MNNLTSGIVLLFLLPCYAFPQQQNDTDSHLSVVILPRSESLSPNQMITPLLLRSPRHTFNTTENDSWLSGSPAVPFFSSLLLPGTGQLVNRNWWRSGLYIAIEAVSLYLTVDYHNRGRRGEQAYERWADQHWSVIKYSGWLVNYHDVHGLDNPYVDELRQQISGVEPAFHPDTEWPLIDLSLLRSVERRTPFVTPDGTMSNMFSHTLPEFGSQQYYELIAKYYQYQAGWRDYDQFHDELSHTDALYNERFKIDHTGGYASPLFFDGARRSEQFNNDFRRSGYFLSMIIVNHVISAFDGFFSAKLKQNRLRATSSMLPGQQIVLSYRF